MGFSSLGSWWKPQDNHKCVRKRGGGREAGIREKRQGKKGHISLDAISLQETPALVKHVWKTHRTLCYIICHLFQILFEGGQNNDMCSLLASSVESFKHAFLPPRSFLTDAFAKGLALPGADAENMPRLDLTVAPWTGPDVRTVICRASSTSLWSAKIEVLHLTDPRQCSLVVKNPCYSLRLSGPEVQLLHSLGACASSWKAICASMKGRLL